MYKLYIVFMGTEITKENLTANDLKTIKVLLNENRKFINISGVLIFINQVLLMEVLNESNQPVNWNVF